jgi:anti-sigma regulatory factor (Ser/Thr protein kinase)
MTQSFGVPVADPSAVAEARRCAQALAQQAGLDEVRLGKLGLVVTEAATNILKHATQGEIVLRLLRPDTGAGAMGVEMLAIDQGPGMADVALCQRDGFSTAGSPGTGLGAIARLADWYDIYSSPQAGTVVAARVWAETGRHSSAGPLPAEAARWLEVGGVSLPVRGEQECGDAWGVAPGPDETLVVLADGLGHGAEAAVAARQAVRSLLAVPPLPTLTARLEAAHEALRTTRGAAVALAAIHPARGTLTFAGVGNIAGAVLLGGGPRNMVSHAGTLGHTRHRLAEFTYTWEAGAVLVLHSDGLSSHARLEGYPGLARRDPAVVAAVLHRDFTRGRDDSTVVVARQRPAPEGQR